MSTTTTAPSARVRASKTLRPTAWKSERIFDTFIPEIQRRGGEAVIWDRDRGNYLEIEDRHKGMILLRAEGWRQYSRAFGARPATLAYLVGVDDNGQWAAWVPGTCETVKDAVAALTPAAVKDREHLRQGDVYLVHMNGGAGTPDVVINETHIWDAASRTLTHVPERGEAHRPVTAPAEWKAVKLVPQISFQSNRGYTAD